MDRVSSDSTQVNRDDSKIQLSICMTIYNSHDVISNFLSYVQDFLNETTELIAVDSFSRDGTYEILKKFELENPNVKIIREKCSRGRGRQLAIQNASGDVILVIDADEKLYRVQDYVNVFQKNYRGKVMHYHIKEKPDGASLECTIALKRTILSLGGYPNLNFFEDVYLWSIAERLGLLEQRIIKPEDADPLRVRGGPSGKESRYSMNIFETIKRRLVVTRDIVFVRRLDFSSLCKVYKLYGRKKYLYGFPLYFLGRFLRFTIKDEPWETRLKKIADSVQTANKAISTGQI